MYSSRIPSLLLLGSALLANVGPSLCSPPDLSAQDILAKGIAALGGVDALNAVKGVRSHVSLYRSQSLQESVTPNEADQAIATFGTQTISYNTSGGYDEIIQRIDRDYAIGEFWDFGRPHLEPMSASIVTRSGPTGGYTCYVKGNEGIYTPPGATNGYIDPYQANLFLREAVRLYPKLLLGFSVTPNLEALTITSHGLKYPALRDAYLSITVAFDPVTYLPHIIRAYEDHKIYGNSTNDFVVYNYTTINNVKFPRRIKLLYNEDSLLQDLLIDTIEVNPTFPDNYFEGLPASEIQNTFFQSPPKNPATSTEFGDAEIFEQTMNLLWYGGYAGNLSRVTVTYPIPSLPGLIHLVFNDSPAYTTTIIDTGDAVMVTDAPHHQSKLVIQWIHENLKKKVTHLLVTHHHHDHNYGAADYVAEGAYLVVPEDYEYYWKNIPGVKFKTADENKPFIHKSKTMQVRGVWPGVVDVHAADWMYFTFTEACPKNGSPIAVEVADCWSPGAVGYEFNQFLAVEYLAIVRSHKLPRNNLVIPIHGVPSNATDLYEATGYDYPNYQIEDFKPGGEWC